MAENETRDGIPVAERPAWQTVRDLLPFMWLEGRWDLRRRVMAAVACLVVVRAIGLYIPFIYKDIVDSLSAGVSPEQLVLWTPVALILAWGGLQIFYQLTSYWQQALLWLVSEALDRTLSTRAFAHVTSLSMGFHLKKRTDSLARIVRRGASYADFLLRIVIFDLLPMAIEFLVITALIIVNFGWIYAGIILVSGVLYLIFTGLVAEWRKKFHRALIEAGQESGTRFFDAVTNVESVKNFTNKDHEYRRYDRSLKDYEDASVRDDMSASVFGIGQGLVYKPDLAKPTKTKGAVALGARCDSVVNIMILLPFSQFDLFHTPKNTPTFGFAHGSMPSIILSMLAFEEPRDTAQWLVLDL